MKQIIFLLLLGIYFSMEKTIAQESMGVAANTDVQSLLAMSKTIQSGEIHIAVNEQWKGKSTMETEEYKITFIYDLTFLCIFVGHNLQKSIAIGSKEQPRNNADHDERAPFELLPVVLQGRRVGRWFLSDKLLFFPAFYNEVYSGLVRRGRHFAGYGGKTHRDGQGIRRRE